MEPEQPTDPSDEFSRMQLAVQAFHEFAASGGDTEAFLASHPNLRDLLEPMVRGDTATRATPWRKSPHSELSSGAVLDDFRIVAEIGRGGMGIVYEAEQLSLQRRVALKILPDTLAMAPDRIERFRREAAAAARLNHVGILPVYCVGETQGTHFFAMERIDGESLEEALERAHREQNDTATKTATAGRLGILPDASPAAEVADVIAQIAEGIAAAHASGVIHRDIKPQNVLIDRHSDPHASLRVVDFGIAKDLDQATLSQTGDLAGTPQYMSPEQIAGTTIDARTDIFSLGVVMYRCLTLRAPFLGESKLGVMNAVANHDPIAPRNLDAAIPHDLEIICLKALEKTREDRYQTIAELAADLRRFLRHEPILAQPPGPWRRLTKAVRRNRAKSILAAMAGLMVVLGILGYFTHLELSNAALAAEKLETSKQRDLAFTYLGGAQAALNRLLLHVETLAARPGLEALHRKTTEEVVQYLDQLNVTALGSSPTELDLIYLAGRARSRLARTYNWLGDRNRALTQIAAAEAALQEIEKRGSRAAKVGLFRATLLGARATVRMALGQDDRADELLVQGLAVGSELAALDLPPNQRAELALKEADMLQQRAALLNGLGGGVRESKRAVELLQRAERKLASGAAGSPRIRARLAQTIPLHRAIALRTIDDPAALASAKESEQRGRERLALDHNPVVRRDLGHTLRNLASIQEQLGQAQLALANLSEAIDLMTKLVADFPTRESFRFELARALISHAGMLDATDKHEQCRQAVAKAGELLNGLQSDHGLDGRRARALWMASDGLVAFRARSIEIPRAIRRIQEAVERMQQIVDEHPASALCRYDLCLMIHNLAIVLATTHDESAGTTARRALVEYERTRAANPHLDKKHELRRKLMGQCMEAHLLIRDHEGAAEMARKFHATFTKNGRAVLQAGRILAASAGYAQQDLALSEPQRAKLVTGYLDDCMLALRAAVKLGYRGASTLRTSPLFRPLQSRQDFQELLSEVDALRAKRDARRRE